MSIITALPGIVPAARDYSMGRWPQVKKKMRNGRTVCWGLSSKPTGDRMALAWENITYEQAEQLCEVWDANYGIYGEVDPPSEIRDGTSGDLRALLNTPFPGATWHFVGSPQVEAVKAGRCTVSVLIGVRGFVGYDT